MPGKIKLRDIETIDEKGLEMLAQNLSLQEDYRRMGLYTLLKDGEKFRYDNSMHLIKTLDKQIVEDLLRKVFGDANHNHFALFELEGTGYHDEDTEQKNLYVDHAESISQLGFHCHEAENNKLYTVPDEGLEIRLRDDQPLQDIEKYGLLKFLFKEWEGALSDGDTFRFELKKNEKGDIQKVIFTFAHRNYHYEKYLLKDNVLDFTLELALGKKTPGAKYERDSYAIETEPFTSATISISDDESSLNFFLDKKYYK